MNVLGPGGTEHQSLAVRANLADNFTDLRLETHVKHAVSLIHNEVGDTAKVRLARLEHIDKTTWSRYDNLDTALQVTNLGAFGSATVNSSVTDARVRAELGALLLNLDSKFTSWGENQSDGTVTGRKKRLPAI